MHLNKLAKLMRTAGDESRLKILCVIFDKKKICVSDVAKETHMNIAIVSHHLRVMSKEGLMTSVREGKKICYAIPSQPFVKDLEKFVCKYRQLSK